MWDRKALPSPAPSAAPATRPAMSVMVSTAGTLVGNRAQRRGAQRASQQVSQGGLTTRRQRPPHPQPERGARTRCGARASPPGSRSGRPARWRKHWGVPVTHWWCGVWEGKPPINNNRTHRNGHTGQVGVNCRVTRGPTANTGKNCHVTWGRKPGEGGGRRRGGGGGRLANQATAKGTKK